MASVSAPECLFSYLFARTTHIRFRHAIMLLPFMINHPLRVAERIATEDVLSDGRIELGVHRVAVHLFPARREMDFIALDVEVPQAVVGGALRKLEAFFQLVQSALDSQALEAGAERVAEELQ